MDKETSVTQPEAEAVPVAAGSSAEITEAAAPLPEDSGRDTAQGGDGSFESLIRGKYREQYRARVSAIVRDRLKGAKETVEKYEKLAPAIGALAEKLGVSADDAEGLARAIAEGSAPAGSEHTDSAPVAAEAAAEDGGGADRVYSAWVREAEEAKAVFPSLDLREELGDPNFRALLLGGVGVAEAYTATHIGQILPAAMRFAVKEAGRKISGRIAENESRAAENGASPSGASLPVSDVKSLSKAQRLDIIRRVGKGEKISF